MLIPTRRHAVRACIEPMECRRHLDGEYDTSFSVDGKVITSFGQPGPAEALAVAVQPNGKAVAAGFATFTATVNGSSVRAAVIARYNLDGTLDSSFEGDGQWVGPTSDNGQVQYVATDIAAQPDGKIVVLIRTTVNGVIDGGELRKFLSNGNPDPDFGDNGIASILTDGATAEVRSLKIDRQDRIVVAGTFESDGVIARFTSGGQPDPSFGLNGRRIISRGASTRLLLSEADVMNDNRVVVAGGTESPHSRIVVRLTNSGNPDNDFAIGGIAREPTSFVAQYTDLALEPNGFMWVGGHGITATATSVVTRRYAIDGSTPGFGTVESSTRAYSALDRLTGGKVLSLVATTTAPKLRRLLDGGPGQGVFPDPSFNSFGGSPGEVSVFWTSATADSADALAVSPTGRAYVVGSAEPAGQVRQFAVAALVGGPNQAPVIDRSSFEFETGHRLRFIFSEPINPATLEISDLYLHDLDTGLPVNVADATVAYDSVTRTARISLSNLPDGNYRGGIQLNSIADVGGATNSESTGQFDYFVLAGDANRDRSVSIGDFSILAVNFNQPGTFSHGDFNYSGAVEIGDFAILASKFNSTLPPPGPPGPPGSSVASPVIVMPPAWGGIDRLAPALFADVPIDGRPA